jgi:prefoldin subunit 5
MLAQERGAPSPSLSLSLDDVEDQIAHLEAQREQIETALAELKRQRDALRAAA